MVVHLSSKTQTAGSQVVHLVAQETRDLALGKMAFFLTEVGT